MEELLKQILEELKYQTKLLESAVERGRADGVSDNMERAMQMVMNMPLMQQMGMRPDTMRSMMGMKKPGSGTTIKTTMGSKKR